MKINKKFIYFLYLMFIISAGCKSVYQFKNNDFLTILTDFLVHADFENEKYSTQITEEIKNNIQYSEMIPYYSTKALRIFISDAWQVSDKWIIASFDEGHSTGYLLLKIIKNDSGEIRVVYVDADTDYTFYKKKKDFKKEIKMDIIIP